MIKPILFSTQMVQAILEGQKTQTRRVIKTPPCEVIDRGKTVNVFRATQYDRFNPVKPPYEIGDILYVRETFQEILRLSGPNYIYRADKINRGSSAYYNEYAKLCDGWKPSIHMPKEAARIFLRVTNVRVGRLQDIGPEDAKAEGAGILNRAFPFSLAEMHGARLKDYATSDQAQFVLLWDSIYEKRGYGWVKNPWVWVIDFEHCNKPEDI